MSSGIICVCKINCLKGDGGTDAAQGLSSADGGVEAGKRMDQYIVVLRDHTYLPSTPHDFFPKLHFLAFVATAMIFPRPGVVLSLGAGLRF